MSAPRVGVSACLLGQRVRWDGGHKLDDLLTGPLAGVFEYVPVCPEVELGLGTPREPIRLERGGDRVRLVAPGSGRDHTDAMRRLAERRVRELAALELCGFVLKQDSPSCGLEQVPVWGSGAPSRDGRGAFAAVLTEALPLLPVVEEGQLRDPALRERFVAQVLACHRAKERRGR